MKRLLLTFALTLFTLALGINSKPTTFALVSPLASPAVPIDCQDGCGAERWNIKTLTDENADNVDFIPQRKEHSMVPYISSSLVSSIRFPG